MTPICPNGSFLPTKDFIYKRRNDPKLRSFPLVIRSVITLGLFFAAFSSLLASSLLFSSLLASSLLFSSFLASSLLLSSLLTGYFLFSSFLTSSFLASGFFSSCLFSRCFLLGHDH